MSGRLAVLGGATLFELTIGELPERFHPVVWMGRACSRCVSAAPPTAASELAIGALVAIGVPVAFAAAAACAPAGAAGWVLRSILLGSSFSLIGLRDAAFALRDAVQAGDLPLARSRLGALCSRDARALDAPALISGAVESIAENTSDSVVAPLFWYAACGLPGAVAYRAVNTLDAMIGYRGRYEYLGKAAARLDDVMNYVPARLTAVLLLAVSRPEARALGLMTVQRDARQTESPNAGFPMAAMAGLLGVRLSKAGQYALGDAKRPLKPGTVDQAWGLARAASVLALLLTAAWVHGHG